MGDNYIGNNDVGRACHAKRMNFEKILIKNGGKLILNQMYANLATQNIGREIVIFAIKI